MKAQGELKCSVPYQELGHCGIDVPEDLLQVYGQDAHNQVLPSLTRRHHDLRTARLITRTHLLFYTKHNMRADYADTIAGSLAVYHHAFVVP